MATTWQITVDCAEPGRLAAFWVTALGYVPEPPPPGHDSWGSWFAAYGVPEEEWDDGASIVDPDGEAPKIGFLKVPEGKVAKNRLHLDVLVNGSRADWRPEDQRARTTRVRATVATLLAAGGSVVREDHWQGNLDHVVMADPEGNEFCVR